MAPLVRRPWGPCGQTPVFYQRTRSYKKVSAIAALCVAPGKDNVRLYFRLHPGKIINTALVLDFLKELDRQLGAPSVLVWDNLTAHRSKPVRDFLDIGSGLAAFYLPPYAPELDPVEYLTRKSGRLPF